MSLPVTLNGTTYNIPQTGDDAGWGDNVTNYLVALSTGILTKAGGPFTLSGEVDFGATAGLKSIYFKSRGTTSTTGVLRLASTESLSWRNAANSADLALATNGSDQLTFAGNPIVTLALGSANTALVMNSGGTAYQWSTITNAQIDVAAAIAYSKLALTGSVVDADISASAAIARSKVAAGTASQVLINDGSGLVSSEATLAKSRGGSGQDNTSLTFPSTGTLATRAGIETLSNKTLDNSNVVTAKAANLTIQDGTDTTKQAKFVASGITTGTTRSYTLPNASDTLAVLATAQTLTNKTFDSTSTMTGAKIASFTPDGTHTLTSPAATDTLVGRATTDTLSNKTLQTIVGAVTSDSTTTGSSATLPSGDAAVATVRLTNASLASLSGITAGAAGQMLMVQNLTAATITVKDNDAGAAAANRIRTGTGGSLNMIANATYIFVYDGTAQLWMLTGANTGGLSPWAASTAYTVGTVVTSGRIAYTCILANTSTASFDTDVASGYWAPLNLDPTTKNYVYTGGNFESGTVGGWQKFNATLTGVIPTGSPTLGTAASISSLTTTSTSPLAGGTSLTFSSAASAAISAGQGIISQPYTIDQIDQARMLAFRFGYMATSGSNNMNFSGTSSNTWAAYIYDVTNGQWIQPAGVYNLIQGTGVGLATGTWQTPSNMTQFRIALLCINSTGATGTTTMMVDSVYCGPQALAQGPAMGDWTPYTPTFTGFGTPTNISFFSRRVGDSLEVRGNLQCGTPTAVQAQITLGYNGTNANVTIDSSKIAANSLVGRGEDSSTASTQFGGVTVLANGGNNYLQFSIEASTTNPVSPANGNTVFSSSSSVSFFARVPIAAWSSNAVSSADTDGRQVAFSAGSNSISQTTPGGWQTITGLATTVDTHGAYNSSTGIYTAPVSGLYLVSGNVGFNPNSTGSRGARVRLNGNDTGTGWYFGVAASTGPTTHSYSGILKCVAGDQISLQGMQASGATLAYQTDGDINTRLNIQRLAGAAVIQATETVACEYSCTSALTLNNGAFNYVDFPTKESDTHGAVVGAGSGIQTSTATTWRFVAPVSGRFHVDAIISANTISNAFLWDGYAMISVNNSIVMRGQRLTLPVGSDFNNSIVFMPVSGNVRLKAGDYIEIQVYYANGGNRSFDTEAGANRVTICRVGNY